MKHLNTILVLLAATTLCACGDSGNEFEQEKQQNAKNTGDDQVDRFKTAIDYAERVTAILKQVTDDASAQKAITQIDSFAQQRKIFNDVRKAPLTAGTQEQLNKLRDAKKQLDQVVQALDQEIQRIIFSGAGNTAIPKTGPMREVTRAVRVAKPQRRR